MESLQEQGAMLRMEKACGKLKIGEPARTRCNVEDGEGVREVEEWRTCKKICMSYCAGCLAGRHWSQQKTGNIHRDTTIFTQ